MIGKVKLMYEADLEKYGTDLLALDGWRGLKTDPVKNWEWGKGFGEKGMADHLYLRYSQFPPPLDDVSRSFGQILWIEWKRRKGKPKPHQIEWIELERKRGALVWLADKEFVATPEGFFNHYKASGLMIKQITPSFEEIGGLTEEARRARWLGHPHRGEPGGRHFTR